MKRIILPIIAFMINAEVTAQMPDVPANGLRAYYKFENNINNNANPSVNYPTPSVFNLNASVSPFPIGSFVYAAAPNETAFNPVYQDTYYYTNDSVADGLTDFTVSAYVQLPYGPSAYPNYNTIFSNYRYYRNSSNNLVGQGGTFVVRINSEGKVEAVLAGQDINNSPVWSVASTNDTIFPETNGNGGPWHHVAVTFDVTHGKIAIYIDGVEKGSFSGTLVTGGIPVGFTIGGAELWRSNPGQMPPVAPYSVGITNPLDGYIDEVAIYERALSECDVKHLFNRAKPVNASISVNGSVLQMNNTTNATGFQWYDCVTNQSIAGATSSVFTPADNNHTYYLVATGACGSDTSVCLSINAAVQHTINTSANPSAGGTVNGGGSYNMGTTVTVTATPNAGYKFVKWTENGTNVSTNDLYTFIVNADRTLVAEFELITGIDEVINTITTVYPNPANTILNVTVKENTNIKIVNLLGATVATQELQTGNNTVDVKHLTNGIYFIHNANGGAIKFTKE